MRLVLGLKVSFRAKKALYPHTTLNRVILTDEAEHRQSCRPGRCRLCFLPACGKAFYLLFYAPLSGEAECRGAV